MSVAHVFKTFSVVCKDFLHHRVEQDMKNQALFCAKVRSKFANITLLYSPLDSCISTLTSLPPAASVTTTKTTTHTMCHQIAHAYSHLSERNVYVEFLENLAGSYPTVHPEASNTNNNNNDDDVHISMFDESEPRRGAGAGALIAGGNVGGAGAGENRLAADLSEHRLRVSDILRRLPPGDAR